MNNGGKNSSYQELFSLNEKEEESGKSITGGSEGSGSPVGYPAKQEATRTSQPKRAASALQARAVTIEVADRDPQSHFLRKQ